MLRSLAVARIQQGLGFRTDKSDEIISALQEEQRDLEKGKSLPRFLLREDQTLSITSGNQSVSLPSDFLRRDSSRLRYLATGETEYSYIGWRGYDNAELAYAHYDAAGPQAAVLRSATIKFYPEPDADYTVYWNYYKTDTVLDANIENTWLAEAPELLIGGAGLRIAKDLRNKEAIKLFSEMYAMARASVFGDIVLEDQEESDFLQLGANA